MTPPGRTEPVSEQREASTTVTDPAGAGADTGGGDGNAGYRRSPRDLLRLVVYLGLLLVAALPTLYAEDSVLGLEEDILRLFDRLPVGVERVFVGLLQLTVVLVAAIVLVGVPLVTRRLRLVWMVLVGGLAADLAVRGLAWWLERRNPPSLVVELASRGGIASRHFPSAATLGAMAAVLVIAGPFVSRRWRRAGAIVLALVTLCRLLAAATLPADLFVALAAGAVVGTAVLLAFGRPDRRAPAAAISAALIRAGLPVVSLRPASVDARGSTPYFGSLADGRSVFVKLLGSEERSADLLFRLYRFVRLEHVGDERPFSSLRREVEHEALVSLRARDIGVRTPRFEGLATVDDDSMVLAYEGIAGRSLDKVDPESFTDDVLRQIWEQVGILRHRRIAHRDLRLANVFLDDQDLAWLIDFGFSELAARDGQLNGDVAELLTSTSLKVGPTRAVDAAVSVLGPAAVASSMGRLQPNALSGATRRGLKERKGLLTELRDTVSAGTGTPPPPLEHLERISGRTVLLVLMCGAALYFLLPQIGSVDEMWRRVQAADWRWLPAILAMSALTYVGATVSMFGAVPIRLRALPTLLAQTASSFVNRVTPANVGGMALNARFLQKCGLDSATAVAGVGLNSVGGAVVHLVLTALFLVWAGQSAFRSLPLPSPRTVLLGVAVVAVVTVGAFLVPAVRHAVVHKVGRFLSRSLTGAVQVVRRPGKVALLLGGSAIVTTTYIFGLYYSSLAFGAQLSLVTVGAVYLAGSAIASAAPTPGGLGAVEAVLIGGLIGAGMPSAVAVPAVLLFRLATFWLPVLPGWLSFAYLRRADYL